MRKQGSVYIILFVVLAMITQLPLAVWAAEQSDWKRIASTPRITFLNEMGDPLAEELTDLYVGDDSLSFDDSKVSYGEIKELDYAAVNLNFYYVDYNYYVEEEQIDESGTIQGLQAIARLDFGDESIEESHIGFSRDHKSGYLIADIEFKGVNPFVDENNAVTLFIQYVSDYSEETVTYKSEMDYIFSQRMLPSPPEEIEKEDEKLEVEIVFPEPPEEEVSIRTETPYILIESCTINEGVDFVTAGSQFSLNLTLKNTHRRMSLDNVRMQVDTPEGLRLEHAGNSFYLGDMKKNGTLEQELFFSSLPSAQMEDYRIGLSFDYEYVDDDTRRYETTKVEVTVPLRQTLKLIVDPIQTLPEYVTGEEQSFYSPYANHSHSMMYYVTATVETELFAQKKVIHLGNLSAGEGGALEFVLLGTEAGTYPVTVTYNYENEWGQLFSEKTVFELKYIEKAEEETTEVSEEPHMTILPTNTAEERDAERPYVVLLGLAACSLLVVLLVLWHNLKKEQ